MNNKTEFQLDRRRGRASYRWLLIERMRHILTAMAIDGKHLHSTQITAIGLITHQYEHL